MIDRYMQLTREHQSELRLDAVNQRLVAQARLGARPHAPRSSIASYFAGFARRFTGQRRWRLGNESA
jgi:hypothetical protein